MVLGNVSATVPSISMWSSFGKRYSSVFELSTIFSGLEPGLARNAERPAAKPQYFTDFRREGAKMPR